MAVVIVNQKTHGGDNAGDIYRSASRASLRSRAQHRRPPRHGGSYGERAVAGATSGLLGLDEEVTWQARHFGVTQRLRVKMTQFERPLRFQDIMLEGAFRSMKHDHSFQERDGGTLMRDRFQFFAPLGILGRVAERLFLTKYMRGFLEERNAVLKRVAESNEWRKYLSDEVRIDDVGYRVVAVR